MPKGKVTIIYRITHWFSYHPWLKVISLILAIIAWFYVKGEISIFKY